VKVLEYALDLHRHDEYSSYDGFGKATDNVKIAKAKGIKALGIANHGNMNGLVLHWKACLEEGIKPILGVEAYFIPKFDKKDPSKNNNTFHLCIFARDLQGYKNLNRIMTAANIKQKYKKPIVDFPLLEKYGEGLIITSGCIASFISQTIAKGKVDIAKKAIKKFVSIVGKDNFYIEVQPYGLDEEGLQEKVNVQLIKFAKELGLRMVLASDSHYGSEHDYDTYMKMHEIKESDDFAGNTYEERYMPDKKDLVKRFVRMHKDDFKDIKKLAAKIVKDADKLIDSVEENILGQLELELPRVHSNSAKLLWDLIIKGLKEKGLHNKKYVNRCKEEYDVIVHHGFEDYFLIVADYTVYAKKKGIKVGPGRGSVCNSVY
jgi:DNA polymerase-3 subunit alpha